MGNLWKAALAAVARTLVVAVNGVIRDTRPCAPEALREPSCC
jgi:hypothetical protein